jgi:hypothetical protein
MVRGGKKPQVPMHKLTPFEQSVYHHCLEVTFVFIYGEIIVKQQ